jgi:ABC-type sulfate transport system substrate-binding protein
MQRYRLRLALWFTLTIVVTPAYAAELLNASYDVTRELFDAIKPALQAQCQTLSGRDCSLTNLHLKEKRTQRHFTAGGLLDQALAQAPAN